MTSSHHVHLHVHLHVKYIFLIRIFSDSMIQMIQDFAKFFTIVQVTNGGPWIAILEHVLQSRVKGGRCVFATFYRQEAEVQKFWALSRYSRHP